jgi:hypothetical protein
MSKGTAEKTVAKLCQETLNTDYSRLAATVDSVTLVKTASNENKYRGEIQISGFAGQYRLSVSVIADKDSVLYELEPAALVVLSGAIERADVLKAEIKADAEKKTLVAVQNYLDAKYSALEMRIRSVQLAETRSGAYEGVVNAREFGRYMEDDDAGPSTIFRAMNYVLPVTVTAAGDDVQYEINPEVIAALDHLIEVVDALLARGIGEYLGTWSRKDDRYGDIATYTISAEKVTYGGDSPFHVSVSRNKSTQNPVQWHLLIRNKEDDYFQVGYRLSDGKLNNGGDYSFFYHYDSVTPSLFLHKTDSTKILINGLEYTRKR